MKHAELLKKWLDGVDIQYRSDPRSEWRTFGPEHTYYSVPNGFSDSWELREKPPMKRYRVGINKNGCLFLADNKSDEMYLQDRPCFGRWLAEWVEYE